VSYINVFQVFSEDDALKLVLPRLIAHGVVRDRVVKENGKWQIAERIYDQLSVLGSLIPDTTLRAKASENLSP
jgi:hypothetical protein